MLNYFFSVLLELIVVLGFILVVCFILSKTIFKNHDGASIGSGSWTPYESEIVYQWLRDNTEDVDGHRYKSTKEISEACNLTSQQVFRGCFYCSFIFRLDDDSKEMWTIYPDENIAPTKYSRNKL